MMTKRFRSGALAAALISLALVGCKSDESSNTKPGSETETTTTTAAEVPKPEPQAETEKAPAPDNGDYFYVEVSHSEPKPDDPVRISFPNVRIVSSSIELGNLEAASAELALDIWSLDSGIPKRDKHLTSSDYFDADSFAAASIKVKDVKKKDEKSFSAVSEVTVHGVTKTWPVEFTIVETSQDSITIQAEHAFQRTDFDIGKAEGDPAANEVVAKLRVTLPAAAS